MSCSKTEWRCKRENIEKINVWQTLKNLWQWARAVADGGRVLKGNPWLGFLVVRSSFKAEAAPRPLAGNYVPAKIDWLPCVIKIPSEKGFSYLKGWISTRSFVSLCQWQERPMLKSLADCNHPSSITWHVVGTPRNKASKDRSCEKI